ncbi:MULTISPECIES: CBO0543 family protein [Metabacillus]|uniref:Uncharacterized protein n=2 Tax=Metabacillus TaxID=2675233 RepID=A0ABX6SE07_9BACI|nr:CBO0543 family protein [Metabacillus sp. KUDC1714]QNF30086.1 hypothetical protein HUW50_23000 [Metabacillus sp. KUDC1714]
MPKKMTYFEMYTTSLFSTVLQLITDIYLEFKFHLYWYFSPEVDNETLWFVFWIYPAVNIIFLNFYPIGTSLLRKQLIYILGWSTFAIAYEWTAVQTGIFQYNGWKLWYSMLIYPLLYILLFINWSIIKKLHRLAI